MDRTTLRQIVTIVTVAATIAFNVLANALPLNGLNTGEISDRFQVFFVPAGYVFSIWGLIYMGLVAFAVFQALPSQRENPRLKRVGYLFVLSGLANMTWLLLWHYERFLLAPLALIALVLLLTGIYLRLEIGRVSVSRGERWCLQIPTSVYLGWATVATIANVTTTLYFVGWNGWGVSPQGWAAIMLTAATVIGALVLATRRDFAFVLVLIWAFVGIALKANATSVVSIAAWTLALALAIVLIVGALTGRRKTPAMKPA
ncbi:MAG: hypothetical protein MUO23_03815 [Anaerolineales bacterium]|nr:hypothetical protein [Anaerolineales bacterium]